MLDELVKTIDDLKSRIKEHREQIEAYEVRTRTALIDPMLRALGWDVSDPSLVTIEAKMVRGWADYALLDGNGEIVVLVEAKKLADKDIPFVQIVSYAVSEKMQGKSDVRYCAITNGDVWHLYDLQTQKPLLQTSIVSDKTAKCALQLLGLWRSSMADRLYSEAVQPVVSIKPTPNPVPPKPPPPDPGWIALTGSFDTKGKPAPKSVRFPDGSEAVTNTWLSIALQTAYWLHRTGHLTRENCQLRSSDHAVSHQYILSRDGKHPDSTEFRRPRPIGDGIILNHVGDPREGIRRSIRMLKHFGQDPSRVLLQLP